MNMKKIVAAAVASVMAVSTMAIAASADVTSSISFEDDGQGNWSLILLGDGAISEAADLDLTKIASFDITFSFNAATEEDWAGGAIITQSDSLSWNTIGQWENAVGNGKVFEGVESGKAINVTMEKKFAADDTYAKIVVQNYGIDMNIDSIVIYDEAGAVLLALPKAADPAPAETTEAPATPAPGANDGAGDGKEPANTGIEGVAVVAGLAILATGAIVVAKKRK